MGNNTYHTIVYEADDGRWLFDTVVDGDDKFDIFNAREVPYSQVALTPQQIANNQTVQNIDQLLKNGSNPVIQNANLSSVNYRE